MQTYDNLFRIFIKHFNLFHISLAREQALPWSVTELYILEYTALILHQPEGE
jgi:hypothetical protein